MTKKRLPFPFRIGRGIKLSIVAGIGLLSLPPQLQWPDLITDKVLQ